MCFKNILRKKSAYNLHLANYIENNLLIWMTQFDITLLNKSFKTDKKYKSSFDKQKCNRLNKKIYVIALKSNTEYCSFGCVIYMYEYKISPLLNN